MASHEALMAWYNGLPGWAQGTVFAAANIAVTVIVVLVAKGFINSALKRASRIDETLRHFLGSVLNAVAWLVIAFGVLVALGVDPAILAGGLAVGGFVIGFAMKDALGNLAAGVTLLVYRPINVGEVVTIAGKDGTVEDLGMAMTRLKTFDGRLLTVPNGVLIGDAILNTTRNGTRRVEVPVGIGYGDDIEQAVRALLAAAEADDRVQAEPAPQVVVTGLGASSVDLELRAWTAVSDWGKARSDLTAAAKKRVEAAGCSIPFPQRDVHMIPADA